ncbi:hypothetical protein GCM10009545_41450 [Saccharopolyspora thermophila]|uniref:Uncharacterized protein n=1 Tax=Saccharopolyspora thermophila TaxID=89367 RepID=A0ABN1D578_9PSEU
MKTVRKLTFLFARSGAKSRRAVWAPSEARHGPVVETATITVNLSVEVLRDGAQVHLTPAEWACWRSWPDT